jgi:hypothetical protein
LKNQEAYSRLSFQLYPTLVENLDSLEAVKLELTTLEISDPAGFRNSLLCFYIQLAITNVERALRELEP